MDIFDVLTLIGGLCLFLFGMNLMGSALERSAGSKLRGLLGKLTTKKSAGLLTGMGVTAVIQSSSATTVMVVGFVNSGLMTLSQAINVIMGANIGTTITAWILSLSGIEGTSLFLQFLKPTSFTPILALIGVIFYMFCKSGKKKDIGTILLGFATLMFGMDTMSGAVAGLKNVPEFTNILTMFKNPILGAGAGAVLTAIIQSSSASVGILQALSSTGQITYAVAIPIIMGQNIGTCVTAIISSVGANRNAKRAAYVHLSFNVIGTVVWLIVFSLAQGIFQPEFLGNAIGESGIAVCHSIFNVLCTLLLLPMSSLLEKLVYVLVPEKKDADIVQELDERLLATPSVALENCRTLAHSMAKVAVSTLRDSLRAMEKYTPELAEEIRDNEAKTDHYEDILGDYLVKLSSKQISDQDNTEAAKLLRIIGDFERISDHAVNVLESIEEMKEKEIEFSSSAKDDLKVLGAAVNEILDISLETFVANDVHIAKTVEPLEQRIDELKEQMRARHIERLQKGNCGIEAGFVWSDLLTDLERSADHCSNVAGCIVDLADTSLNFHEALRALKTETPEYKERYALYSKKYKLTKEIN